MVPVVKNLPANAEDIRDVGSTPGLGKSPGVGKGSPLQYSCLENSMEKGAWWATVQGPTKSQTWLSYWTHISYLQRWLGEWISALSFGEINKVSNIKLESVIKDSVQTVSLTNIYCIHSLTSLSNFSVFASISISLSPRLLLPVMHAIFLILCFLNPINQQLLANHLLLVQYKYWYWENSKEI